MGAATESELSDTSPTTSAARVVAEIQALTHVLSPSEARVARVVLADPSRVVYRTATSIGEEAGTSATTVVRFARSVGFPGFQSLALALGARAERGHVGATNPETSDAAETTEEGPRSRSPVRAIADDVARASAAALGGLAETLDLVSLDATITAVERADRILVVGTGMTVPTAMDAGYRLAHLGLPAETPIDPHVQRARARALAAGDVCIVIMHGGTLPATVACADDARRAGATVVALTSYARTPLTRAADLALVLSVEVAQSGVHAWLPRLAHLAVIDMIVSGLLARDDRASGGSGRYARALTDIADSIESEA